MLHDELKPKFHQWWMTSLQLLSGPSCMLWFHIHSPSEIKFTHLSSDVAWWVETKVPPIMNAKSPTPIWAIFIVYSIHPTIKWAVNHLWVEYINRKLTKSCFPSCFPSTRFPMLAWLSEGTEKKSLIKWYWATPIAIFIGSSMHPTMLTGGNWQKWKRVFLTCPFHKIYRDEAVGLKSCKYTWKITKFVKMGNLGQYRENLIFCQ